MKTVLQRVCGFAAIALVAFVGCGGDGLDPTPGADAAPPDGQGPTRISVTIDPGVAASVKVLFQDGDGPWQVATEEGDNTYSFVIASDRYGYGYTCADALGQEAVFAFATPSDPATSQMVAACGIPYPVLREISGEVTGLTGHGFRARINGAGVTYPTSASTATYSFLAGETPSGTLYFGRFADPGLEHVDRLVIRRSVAVTANLVANVAFATEGAATPSRDVTVANAVAGVSVRSRFGVGGDLLGIVLTADETPPYTVEVPANAEWSAADRLTVSASSRADNGDFASVSRKFGAPTDLPVDFALTLPPLLAGVSVEAVRAGPGVRIQGTSQADSAADRYWLTAYSAYGVENADCEDSTCYPYFSVEVTAGWLGSAASPSISTPDPAQLAALGAWDDRLDLPAGATFSYDYRAAHLVDGYSYSAGRSGDLTP